MVLLSESSFSLRCSVVRVPKKCFDSKCMNAYAGQSVGRPCWQVGPTHNAQDLSSQMRSAENSVGYICDWLYFR
jgi:hypothetical protein